MNQANFQQIVNHYIDSFEYTNGGRSKEYYKWQIAKRFKPMMDSALEGSDSDLPTKLYAVKKLSSNLIDSYTQPFHGLCKFAEKEPSTVRRMFQELYSGDDVDVQTRVNHFLEQSLELREKYYPNSFLYKDDMHSVTGYLFLYDPDNNFLYKASHARIFADCIEFFDEWGCGSATKLDVYYRMCEEVLEAINANEPLLSTAASRYEIDPEGMHPDTNRHILLFDMIYCCWTYNLFKGIRFVVPKNEERRLMQERKDKAVLLSQKFNDAKAKLVPLTKGKQILAEALVQGANIQHKTYGRGVIESVDNAVMTIRFQNGDMKKLGIVTSVLKGIISLDDKTLRERLEPYAQYLLNEKQLLDGVKYAEKQLAPYIEYLE